MKSSLKKQHLNGLKQELEIDVPSLPQMYGRTQKLSMILLTIMVLELEKLEAEIASLRIWTEFLQTLTQKGVYHLICIPSFIAKDNVAGL